MAPERITGQSYTITSDVWSLGVTLLEVAQHRFPFPADGTEMQPRAGLIDLLTYIVRQPIPKLKDEEPIEGEEGRGVKWSEGFKYFIECWYVKSNSSSSSSIHERLRKSQTFADQESTKQPGERTLPPRHTLAHARTPLGSGNAQQESQHGAFPAASVGLEGLIIHPVRSGRD